MDKKQRKRGRSEMSSANLVQHGEFPTSKAPGSAADLTFSSSSKTKKKKSKKKRKRQNCDDESQQQQPTEEPKQTSKSSNIKNNKNPSIPISKEDHAATLALLKSMDWTMAKNTSRRNVIRADDKATPRNNKNKPYCMSFIFGRNMKDPTGRMSFWSTKYPKVYAELQTLIEKYDPSFYYTHITLNCNLRCKRHTDGGNAGPSYIAAFGRFSGGQLIVEPPGGGDTEAILDCHSKFVKFNGKTQPHETAPFKGERFTLVYYTSDIVPPTVDRRAASRFENGGGDGANNDTNNDEAAKFAVHLKAMKQKLDKRNRRK